MHNIPIVCGLDFSISIADCYEEHLKLVVIDIGGDVYRRQISRTWISNHILQYSVGISLLVHTSLIQGILPKGPYLPCVSMAGRALLAGYPRYMVSAYNANVFCL